MTYIKGRNLILFNKVNNEYVPIAACASCGISVQSEMIETLPNGSWQWREFVTGKSAWSISANGLIDLGRYKLTDMYKQKISVAIMSVDDHDNEENPEYTIKTDYIRRGTAILAEIKESSEVNGMVTWEVTLQGTGELLMTNADALSLAEATEN